MSDFLLETRMRFVLVFVVVVVMVACASAMERMPTTSTVTSVDADGHHVDRAEVALVLEFSSRELSIPVDLADAVRPLLRVTRNPQTPYAAWCSGAFVGADVFLTAHHCLTDTPLAVGSWTGDTTGLHPFQLRSDGADTACVSPLGLSCTSRFWAAKSPTDIGTLVSTEVHSTHPLGLATVDSAMGYPQMIMLGFGKRVGPVIPRVVCQSQVLFNVPNFTPVDASVVDGDSGAVMVALERRVGPDGAETAVPVILGIVHGGDDVGHLWTFSPITSTLPVPTMASAGLAGGMPVPSRARWDFLDIPGC